MKKLLIIALSGIAIQSAFSQTVLVSTHSNQVDTVGVSSSSNEQNAQYLDFGADPTAPTSPAADSFGVIDFDGSSLKGATGIQALTFTSGDTSYGPSAAGLTSIWVVSDNMTTLEGNTSVTSTTTAPFYGGALGTALLLGTFQYLNDGTNAQVYSVDLASGAQSGALTQVLSDINSASGNVRLVLTDSTGFTSLTGVKATTVGTGTGYGAPTLTVTTQAVPSPASFLPLALGLAGLLVRKRK